MKTAVVTLARNRRDHLRRQAAAVAALDPAPDAYVLVSMDAAPVAPPAEVTQVVAMPVPDRAPLPLAGARNAAIAAVEAAGADLVVCLDVDCLPEPGALGAYRRAALAPDAGRCLLAGPVGRLEALAPTVLRPGSGALRRSRAVAERGPRPVPGPGRCVDGSRFELFWSLSFAVTPALHAAIGGFDEGYVGYGAEDTDYAFRARRAGVGLRWVGGAWVHHQHHPVSDPPVEHLEDILANATRFHDRWGEWPMPGWLAAFARQGLIAWHPDAAACRIRPAVSASPQISAT